MLAGDLLVPGCVFQKEMDPKDLETKPGPPRPQLLIWDDSCDQLKLPGVLKKYTLDEQFARAAHDSSAKLGYNLGFVSDKAEGGEKEARTMRAGNVEQNRGKTQKEKAK